MLEGRLKARLWRHTESPTSPRRRAWGWETEREGGRIQRRRGHSGNAEGGYCKYSTRAGYFGCSFYFFLPWRCYIVPSLRSVRCFIGVRVSVRGGGTAAAQRRRNTFTGDRRRHAWRGFASGGASEVWNMAEGERNQANACVLPDCTTSSLRPAHRLGDNAEVTGAGLLTCTPTPFPLPLPP